MGISQHIPIYRKGYDMPIYDFYCVKCDAETSKLLSFDEYDEFESHPCDGCEAPLTKDNRTIGRGLKTRVIGVSKGNYNSRDWS